MCVQQKNLSDSVFRAWNKFTITLHHANKIFGGLVFPKELPFSGSDFTAREINSKPQNLNSDLP